MAMDEKSQGETMELHLQVTLPRGIPVMAFVGLCQAFEGIVKAFVRAWDMPDELVQIRVGAPTAMAIQQDGQDGTG